MSRTMPAAAGVPQPVNEVRLVGRLAAPPVDRELPSGDRLVSFRVVVDRPRRPGQARGGVDTIDCVAFRTGVRASLARLAPGQPIALEGTLHRRFWRGPAGPASRYEVEVSRARRAPAATSGRSATSG